MHRDRDRDRARPVGHSTLAAFYRALSHETLPVQYIEAVVLGRGEALFIDEEVAIKERCGCGAARRWVRLRGYHSALAGKGLILGNDDEGRERSTRHRAPDIAPVVMFLDAEVIPFYLVETQTPWRKAHE